MKYVIENPGSIIEPPREGKKVIVEEGNNGGKKTRCNKRKGL